MTNNKALEICQTIDDKPAESVILLNLGVTCELTGQIYKAIEWHTLVIYTFSCCYFIHLVLVSQHDS